MLNRNKVGIALGGFLGLVHLVWAILVGADLAQPMMDFIFNLHMVINPVLVLSFDWSLAVGLVIFTSVFGYIIGCVFACIYNWAHR